MINFIFNNIMTIRTNIVRKEGDLYFKTSYRRNVRFHLEIDILEKLNKNYKCICGHGQEKNNGHFSDELEVKQRTAVAQILRSNNVSASAFTASETRSQRTTILENFKRGDVTALIAIKCLDEGIDVPACTTAYLLASSRNPRQFVQRRGRILRRSQGKEKAIIYDFVALLPQNDIGEDSREIDA